MLYVPGTEETDPKKQNMSLQQIGAAVTALQTAAAAWPGATAGLLPFPATQVPSANANTLDDYEEGTWTPTVTFSTPGNLSVAYSLQNAYYTKIGRFVSANFAFVTSTFTYTTASGNLLVNGLPFPAVNDVSYRSYAPLNFQGISRASYTGVFGALVGNTSQLLVLANGMGQPIVNVTNSDVASGGTVILGGVLNYVV